MQANKLKYGLRKTVINRRALSFFLMIFSLMLVFVSVALLSKAGNISVTDGHIYSTELNSLGPTNKWGGDMGEITNTPVTTSRDPFFARYIDSPQVLYDSLAGGNLNMQKYNLVIMQENLSFNVSKVYNTTYSDLNQGVLFPSSLYSGKDNPLNTFDCSNREIFQIGGLNFSACVAHLLTNINMGLLKYKIGSNSYVPVFIVDSGYYTCYNNTNCNFEFLLPIDTSNPYYFYHISKLPEYNIRVWIDSVERNDFEKTALPYYVTTEVTDYYTGNPINGAEVAIQEYDGNDIFIPLRLNGIISKATSITKTNSSGKALFIIAPTEYPTSSNYHLNVSVIVDDEIAKSKELIIDDSSSAPQDKKPLSPSTLLDNAKVQINAMNQISNSLYQWANTLKEARFISLTVYTNGTISPSNPTVQTGAPNVITVTLKNSGGTTINGYVKAAENDGYLVMNPVYNSTETGFKQHEHDMEYIPTSQQFIITPTSYGLVQSNVSLFVYDSSKNLIKKINLNVNSNLDPKVGSSYNNDDMKVIINSMDVVLNSLYYALN